MVRQNLSGQKIEVTRYICQDNKTSYDEFARPNLPRGDRRIQSSSGDKDYSKHLSDSRYESQRERIRENRDRYEERREHRRRDDGRVAGYRR